MNLTMITQDELKAKLEGAQRVAILGVGSRLRGDDAAGVVAAEELKRLKTEGCLPFEVFVGGVAPENLAGKIINYKPTHVIIIDAADSGKQCGEVDFLDLTDEAQVSFSTHRMPTKMLVRYLKCSLQCDVVILGVQPKVCGFDAEVSTPVQQAVEKVCVLIKETLEGLPK